MQNTDEGHPGKDVLARICDMFALLAAIGILGAAFNLTRL
jgi:hypothetical protein